MNSQRPFLHRCVLSAGACYWKVPWFCCVFLMLGGLQNAACAADLAPRRPDGALRIATFNVSLNRNEAGRLTDDLRADSSQAKAIAAAIRCVQPDILLLNEIDYDPKTNNAALFEERYLKDTAIDELGNEAWAMPYHFSAPVNTGERSGLDLNRNSQVSDPEDAWGYGKFPGQYGMAVLSRFEIATARVRTFQQLRWSEMAQARRPQFEDTKESYYSQTIWEQLRLPSKSFWDVPIQTPLGEVHLLASHPTPPAFDGPEDRNGCRNHDEIRLLLDYIRIPSEPNDSMRAFWKDDQGRLGRLEAESLFCIVGDLNCDPWDGESQSDAVNQLLVHPRIAKFLPPQSAGGAAMAKLQAGMNLQQRGDPANDTADFQDRTVGNLRVDYVLPSSPFHAIQSGVLWPDLNSLAEKLRAASQSFLDATDHRLVWVDVRL